MNYKLFIAKDRFTDEIYNLTIFPFFPFVGEVASFLPEGKITHPFIGQEIRRNFLMSFFFLLLISNLGGRGRGVEGDFSKIDDNLTSRA